jgi:hypothetical protein
VGPRPRRAFSNSSVLIRVDRRPTVACIIQGAFPRPVSSRRREFGSRCVAKPIRFNRLRPFWLLTPGSLNSHRRRRGFCSRCVGGPARFGPDDGAGCRRAHSDYHGPAGAASDSLDSLDSHIPQGYPGQALATYFPAQNSVLGFTTAPCSRGSVSNYHVLNGRFPSRYQRER